MNAWPPVPTVDPQRRDDTPAAHTYHRDDPVWVYRHQGGWRPGVAEISSALAVQVRFRPNGGMGEVVDTVMPDHVMRREEVPEVANYIQRALAAIEAELPELQDGQAPLYALLALTKGNGATLQDVHDAWGIWCPDPDHPGLVPFAELPPEVLALKQDQRFLDGIHRAVRRLADDREQAP